MSDMRVTSPQTPPVFARQANNQPAPVPAAPADGYIGTTNSTKGPSLMSKAATLGVYSAMGLPAVIGIGKQILAGAATHTTAAAGGTAATSTFAGLGAMALMKGLAITAGCGLAGAAGVTAAGFGLAALVMPKQTEAWQTVGLGILLAGTVIGGGVGLFLGHGLGF